MSDEKSEEITWKVFYAHNFLNFTWIYIRLRHFSISAAAAAKELIGLTLCWLYLIVATALQFTYDTLYYQLVRKYSC